MDSQTPVTRTSRKNANRAEKRAKKRDAEAAAACIQRELISFVSFKGELFPVPRHKGDYYCDCGWCS